MTGPMSDRLLAEINACLNSSCMVENCPDPCPHRTVTPGQARAMRGEIGRLRAYIAELGDPETEYRFLLADGTESEFDVHNGPCDCQKQARLIYEGPWLAAGGWVSADVSVVAGESGCTFMLPSRADIEAGFKAGAAAHAAWSKVRATRMGSPESEAGHQAAASEHNRKEPTS